jgi:hypothetical protein
VARLANIDRAVLPETKFTSYLLSHDHPRGRAKARFLEAFGFSAHDWRVLRDAVIAHAAANDISGTRTTLHGTRYEIDGSLPSPDGRAPVVRVVWYTEIGDDVPRLVTLVPRRIAGR